MILLAAMPANARRHAALELAPQPHASLASPCWHGRESLLHFDNRGVARVIKERIPMPDYMTEREIGFITVAGQPALSSRTNAHYSVSSWMAASSEHGKY
jgi:hypothetical protein